MTKHAALVLLALLVMLVATRRLRSHPASGGAGSMVYVPIAQQGAPRCNRWRGDDWMPCVLATLTAEAQVSRTPRPTSMPTRASATWAPAPFEPLGGRVWLPITADVTGPGRECSAAWAPNGAWYLAAHCAPYNVLLLRIAGQPVTAWHADAGGRDLAQARAGHGGPVPVLAHPSPGESVTLRPARGDLQGTYYGGAWARQWADGYEIGMDQFEAARPMGVVCVGPGAIGQGDSGGGMYRGAGGELGGIIVAAEDGAALDAWCGDGQRVLVELVP